MKRKLYIIPGYGHTAQMREYLSLKECAQHKGYTVSIISINWTAPISQQLVNLNKNDIVFGFSLGATIARISYKNHPCAKIILGSETPLYRMTKREILSATNKNDVLTEDLMEFKRSITSFRLPRKNSDHLSGERENLRGKKVKGTGHKLTKKYIQKICELL